MLREVLLSLLGGFGQSLKLFCYTLLGALPLGLLVAFGSMSRFGPLRTAVRGLVWIVRGTPLMLQLIVIYYGPGLLSTKGNLWGGGSGGRMLAASVAFITVHSHMTLMRNIGKTSLKWLELNMLRLTRAQQLASSNILFK